MPPAMHHIIDRIYESARQPSGWEAVLGLIAQGIGASSVILLYRNRRFTPASLSAVGGEGLAGRDAEVYRAAVLQQLAAPRQQLGAPGELIPLPDTVGQPAGGTAAQACYRQFGIAHIARGWLFQDAEHSAVMEMHRTQEAAPFETSLLEQLSPLSEHFERAFRIHALTAREQLRQRGLADSIAHLAMGAVLFNDAGQVVFHNEAARTLLAHHPAVRLRKQRLVVDDSQQAELLRQAVVTAAGYRDGDTEEPFSALVLGSEGGEGALRCWVMPLSNPQLAAEEAFDDARAVLFISDPAKPSPLDPARLMTVFDLTRKEAEVAVAIAEGSSVEEIAARHSRTLNTVRSQLKAIYRKTGVQRQSALVRLILDGTHLFSLPPQILEGEPCDG